MPLIKYPCQIPPIHVPYSCPPYQCTLDIASLSVSPFLCHPTHVPYPWLPTHVPTTHDPCPWPLPRSQLTIAPVSFPFPCPYLLLLMGNTRPGEMDTVTKAMTAYHSKLYFGIGSVSYGIYIAHVEHLTRIIIHTRARTPTHAHARTPAHARTHASSFTRARLYNYQHVSFKCRFRNIDQ